MTEDQTKNRRKNQLHSDDDDDDDLILEIAEKKSNPTDKKKVTNQIGNSDKSEKKPKPAAKQKNNLSQLHIPDETSQKTDNQVPINKLPVNIAIAQAEETEKSADENSKLYKEKILKSTSAPQEDKNSGLAEKVVEKISSPDSKLLIPDKKLSVDSKKVKKVEKPRAKNPQTKIKNDQNYSNPTLKSPFIEEAKKPFVIKLIHTSGSRQGKVDLIDLSMLPDSILTIGRDPESVLAFDPYIDQRVSALHSRIFCKNDDIFIEDLRSTNGTRINGIKIFDVTKLRDGDEIELGRKGASFEIYKHKKDSVDAEIKKAQVIDNKVPAKKKNEIFDEKPEKNLRKDSVFSKILKRQPTSPSTTPKVKFWLIFITAFLMLLFVGFVVLVIVLFSELNETKKRNLEYERASRDIIDDIQDIKDNPGSGNGELNIRDREEFQQLKREFDAWKLKQKTGQINPTNQKFQEINEQARDSIYLIVSQIELYDKSKNKKFLCRGSGTGFVVTSDGHLVTNKHVVKPWLFGTTAAKIEYQNLEVLHETYNIFAWRTGSTAFTDNKDLREDTSFSLGNKYLSIVTEGIDKFKIEDIENYGKFRVHESGSSDISILKLVGSQHPHLNLYNEDKELYWQPKQLDPVLTIGFPEGIDFIEGTKVETSPSTGSIRKIENTIAIDAAIIKGNSGGPVIAIDPEFNKPYVIGVVTRVVKDTETMGLCIKSSKVLDLLPEIYR